MTLVSNLLAAPKMKGEDLSNLIIEGESRLKMGAAAYPVKWSVNPYRNFSDVLAAYTPLADFKPPALVHPPLNLPERSESPRTASPWLDRIYREPVLILSLKPAKSGRTQDWNFFVRDSFGKIFYQQKGGGLPPKEIRWDGFSNAGEPLHVGYDYTYSLSLLDEGGNPQRFSGKAFRLDSFTYTEGGKTIFSFDPETLFSGRSSVKLSESGAAYLTEIKDFLRQDYGRKVEVLSVEDDAKFAAARAAVIKNFLMKSLNIPEEDVSSTEKSLAKGGGYKHVQILVK